MVEINDLYTLIFKVDEGSGVCLKFEAEKKCYILTAYHCIKDSILREGEIELLNDDNISFNKKGEIYFNEKKDIALIEIEYIPDLLTVEFENEILSHDDITFIGYPKKALGRKRKRLNGEIDEWNNKKSIKITESINGDFTEDEKTIEIFSGFSGSGVFRKRDQKLTLVGLLKSLPEENFDYKEISCVPIEDIKELVEQVRKKEQKENEITDILKNGKSIELVKVTLENKTLYVGKYPVTFEEYDFYCEEMDVKKPNGMGWGRVKKPVINISWDSANNYCNWISDEDNKYRLLYFDEWKEILKYQNNQINNGENFQKIKEVNKERKDKFGLYGFIGNIYEWCYDSKSNIRIGIGFSSSLTDYREKSPMKPSVEIGLRIVKEII